MRAETVPRFTPRELEVLNHLCNGALNKEIADCLRIAPQTVNAHLHHIYLKCGARCRHDAVHLYARVLRKKEEQNES